MPQPTITTNRQFYPRLEVLRGVAALMVALFHVGQTPYIDVTSASRKLIDPALKSVEFTWPAQIARIVGNGPGAVLLFFILSGFVLTLLIQRLRRLYPVVKYSTQNKTSVVQIAGYIRNTRPIKKSRPFRSTFS